MKILFRIAPLALLAFCSLLHAQTQTPTDEPVEVKERVVLLVDEMLAVRNVPVLLAEKLGYLKDGKMAVTVMNTRYETWHGDMLMDGRIDAVMAYYHHNIVNQSIGRATEAVVTLGITPGVKVLVANGARERFHTLADLKGSRFIAGGAGSSKTTVANLLVVAGGNRLADYTRLGTDGRDKNVEALRAGTADFVVAPTPDSAYYEGQGVASVFADLTTVDGTRKAFGTLFPSSTVFMSSARIKAHPAFAQLLADAFVRTLHYINSHSATEIMALLPPEAIAKGQDRAAYLAALTEAKSMFAGDGRMPEDGARREWAVMADFNPRYATVKPEQTYTNRFVEQALRRFP